MQYDPPADPANAAISDRVTTAVVEPAAVPVAAPLFRVEALLEQQTQWMGTVLLSSRRSHRVFMAVAALSVVALLALTIFASYTRTARVSGWLVPTEGLMRVFAPQPGVVTALYVREGQQVRKGERLLSLSGDVQSSAIGATQAEILRGLSVRRRSLLDQRERHAQLVAHQRKALAKRLDTLRWEYEQMGKELELQRSRVEIARRDVARHRDLRTQGFVSEAAFERSNGAYLEQASRLAELERDRAEKEREQVALEAELSELPLKAHAEASVLEREAVALGQDLASVEARRELTISAPQDGTVTTILAEAGSQANAASPLMSIVPAGSTLQAHLYSPSRAVGFVHTGQRVRLRYQAYPYQKFGHYVGTVTSVSRSALSPAELPPQLSGLVQTPAGGTAAEAVYRITVELERQAVTAYGNEIALQPGAQLEADILLDRRKLYEWALDPLYTVTGKWGL